WEDEPLAAPAGKLLDSATIEETRLAPMRTLNDMPAARTGRAGLLRACWRPWPYVLALLVAIPIAVWAFVYGDQPVVLDAAGYYELGRLIVRGGLGSF